MRFLQTAEHLLDPNGFLTGQLRLRRLAIIQDCSVTAPLITLINQNLEVQCHVWVRPPKRHADGRKSLAQWKHVKLMFARPGRTSHADVMPNAPGWDRLQ